MRLAGAVAVLMCGAVVAPASASSAVRYSPVTLAGSVTMSGSSSWVRQVVLPRATKVSFGDLNVPIQRGRFHGFILRADGPVNSDGLTPFAASIAPGGCVTPGCSADAPTLSRAGAQLVYPSPLSDPFSAVLPAGRYHLYFIADSTHSTASLRLTGLRGHVAIASGAPAQVAMLTPAPDSSGPQGPSGSLGQIYSGGASHTFGAHGGYTFMQQWKLMYGPPTYNHWGLCTYVGAPETSPLGYHYQAPCSSSLATMNTGSVDGGFNTGRQTGPAAAFPEYETDWMAFGPYPHAGQVSLGGFTNTPDVATEAHTAILCVNYV